MWEASKPRPVERDENGEDKFYVVEILDAGTYPWYQNRNDRTTWIEACPQYELKYLNINDNGNFNEFTAWERADFVESQKSLSALVENFKRLRRSQEEDMELKQSNVNEKSRGRKKKKVGAVCETVHVPRAGYSSCYIRRITIGGLSYECEWKDPDVTQHAQGMMEY
jgi:hypothetical protein